ncbi:MAG: hypothetical protein EOM58_03275 [Clostridia bacterium]|nr:hypothetical protein [Clostridia bacterium]
MDEPKWDLRMTIPANLVSSYHMMEIHTTACAQKWIGSISSCLFALWIEQGDSVLRASRTGGGNQIIHG